MLARWALECHRLLAWLRYRVRGNRKRSRALCVQRGARQRQPKDRVGGWDLHSVGRLNRSGFSCEGAIPSFFLLLLTAKRQSGSE